MIFTVADRIKLIGRGLSWGRLRGRVRIRALIFDAVAGSRAKTIDGNGEVRQIVVQDALTSTLSPAYEGEGERASMGARGKRGYGAREKERLVSATE